MVDLYKKEIPQIDIENYSHERAITMSGLLYRVFLFFMSIAIITVAIFVIHHHLRLQKDQENNTMTSLSQDFKAVQDKNEFDLLKNKIENLSAKSDSVDLEFLRKFSDSALATKNTTENEKVKDIAYVKENYHNIPPIHMALNSIESRKSTRRLEIEENQLMNIKNSLLGDGSGYKEVELSDYANIEISDEEKEREDIEDKKVRSLVLSAFVSSRFGKEMKDDSEKVKLLKSEETNAFETEDEILAKIQNLKSKLSAEKKKLVTIYKEDEQQKESSKNIFSFKNDIPCITTDYDNKGNLCKQ